MSETIAITIVGRAIDKLLLTAIEAMFRRLVKSLSIEHKIQFSIHFSNYCDSKSKSKKEQNELNFRYRNSWKSDIYQLKLTAIEGMFRW